MEQIFSYSITKVFSKQTSSKANTLKVLVGVGANKL